MQGRTPGPIAANEALLQTLAEYRQWHALLVDADPRDPLLKALELPTELAPERVEAVEAELEASFSDALLAVLASRVPHLEDQFGMRLDNLGELAREAWSAGCSKELLPVASDGSVFYCVERREHPWTSTTITPWSRIDDGEAPRALAKWLRDGPMNEFWGLLLELEVVEQDADDPPPHGRAESGAGLVPRLAIPQAVVEATAVRVQHAKFGAGRVLRSVGAGDTRKLDIDFGANGVKTILARFVTELG